MNIAPPFTLSHIPFCYIIIRDIWPFFNYLYPQPPYFYNLLQLTPILWYFYHTSYRAPFINIIISYIITATLTKSTACNVVDNYIIVL